MKAKEFRNQVRDSLTQKATELFNIDNDESPLNTVEIDDDYLLYTIDFLVNFHTNSLPMKDNSEKDKLLVSDTTKSSQHGGRITLSEYPGYTACEFYQQCWTTKSWIMDYCGGVIAEIIYKNTDEGCGDVWEVLFPWKDTPILMEGSLNQIFQGVILAHQKRQDLTN